MAKRFIIILGYSLASDGSIQPILKSRLDAAISMYQPTDILLVCGKRPPKAVVPMRCEHSTEAEAMKHYLVAHGIPAENIFKEEESATTFGNAFFSYFIVNSIPTYQPIIIISNEFHEPLVRYCFDKVFGNRYSYTFYAIPDVTLEVAREKIDQWKYVINQLVENCYPLLFSEVKNGDVHAIQSIIENNRCGFFASSVRKLLNLEESTDIIIASEEEVAHHL